MGIFVFSLSLSIQWCLVCFGSYTTAAGAAVAALLHSTSPSKSFNQGEKLFLP